MAKNKLKNVEEGKVKVRSRTYGEHTRAKRGSITEAKLNDNMQQSTLDLKKANVAAQLIKAELDPFRENFKGGLIWHQLVKNFKKQLSGKLPLSVIGLERTEIWELYPLSRFGTHFRILQEFAGGNIKLTIVPNKHPNFKRSFTDGYRISLLAVFPDFESMEASNEGCMSDIIKLSGELPALTFDIPCPAKAKQFLLILKVEASEKGTIVNSHHVKGMRIVVAKEPGDEV